ncbi:MAG: hypothetical protein ACRDXE_10460 [Acidimicrobiales bacterium]
MNVAIYALGAVQATAGLFLVYLGVWASPPSSGWAVILVALGLLAYVTAVAGVMITRERR